jgi:hypothetical protein
MRLLFLLIFIAALFRAIMPNGGSAPPLDCTAACAEHSLIGVGYMQGVCICKEPAKRCQSVCSAERCYVRTFYMLPANTNGKARKDENVLRRLEKEIVEMDPKGVLEELKSIGVFEVPVPPARGLGRPNIPVTEFESQAGTETDETSDSGATLSNKTSLENAIFHAEGLLQALREMRALPNEGSVVSHDPSSLVREHLQEKDKPDLESAAYQEARERALAKLRAEHDVVPNPIPVTPPPVHVSSANTDIIVGSSQSRVRPADPSEFISVGRG